ncbi:DBIRD complex subunit ZNF326 [Chanos chanos]|uniref:DBIRD complex subunit ZNF326 n=1 Tax=Chanos chanos TaxID=29144 RepID=A0A6J2WR13_CHACN|nr:DBIRD complex subunit ZNF326 [Chanos chanos]
MIRGDTGGRFTELAPISLDEPLCDSFERYGTREPYNSGFSKAESNPFNSGYGNYEGGYHDDFTTTWADDESSSWDSSYYRPGMRSSVSDSSRGSVYSSFSDLSTTTSSFATSDPKPAPVGSRGRVIPSYFQNHYGGRGTESAAPGMFGRPSPLVHLDYQHASPNFPVFRTMKRKMIAPVRPTILAKKQRTIRMGPDISIGVAKQKKLEARREKQRRRREKNNEKYGDMYRLAFTCTFCKFRTFEDKDIEKHFGSTSHKETLDHIRKQAKFDDRMISFLHDSMVHKFRKAMYRKQHGPPEHHIDEGQKVMEGVTEDDYMRKMEVVHCMSCDTHIPAIFGPVQQHLNSETHLKNKVLFKEQMKRDSVLTANSIINSPDVKARYEKYIKGEDPFAKEEMLTPAQESEGAMVETDNDQTKSENFEEQPRADLP